MLVGIDLGPQNAKIACRQEEQWHYLQATPFLYEAQDGNGDEEKALTSCLSSLDKHIDFISCESAGISYPNYWHLSCRQSLLDACQSALNSRTVSLLPGPIAAMLGHESTQRLGGDILLVELYETRASFSLLTVVQPGRDLCLEIQLPLEYRQRWEPALENFIADHLQPQARELGFWASGSWRLDAAVLVGEEPLLHKAAALVNNIFAPRELIIPPQAEFQIARGLAEWAACSDRCRVRAVYPFEFALETSTHGSGESQFAALPFDTHNLAIDLKARYLLAALTANSPFNLGDGRRVHYRLWERPSSRVQDKDDRCSRLIWEYESTQAYTPEPLGVYLHMGKFIIESEMIGQASILTPASWDLNSDYLNQAQRLLAIPFLNAELKKDLQKLASPPEGYDLNHQLEAARLRLLAFLQLFQSV